MKKFQPIGKNFPHMIHGGDYNPDQWLEMPEIINEDIRLIPIANCNAMSINIFSWATIEPEEGKYDFSFLDMIMDKLHSIGAKAVLATPSGARPAWMSQAHPEVLRVSETRVRNLHGERHNHCYTSGITVLIILNSKMLWIMYHGTTTLPGTITKVMILLQQ